MKFKDAKQRKQTDIWLKNNGVNVAHIYQGTTELFQATKLATTTLRNFGRYLNATQVTTLHNFLKATQSERKRERITNGQCFAVMNIAKQAQRKVAKLQKHRF